MAESPETPWIIGGVVVAALPTALVLVRWLTLRGSLEEKDRAFREYFTADHVLQILLVSVWCALWEFDQPRRSEAALWLPVTAGAALGQIALRLVGRNILASRRSLLSILSLTTWSVVCPTISLVLTARAFDAMFDKRAMGVFWLFLAGFTALVGMLRLQSAAGIKPRRVKSGRLFNRAMRLAKRAGVKLERVSVVPAGVGRLSNAFSRGHEIAVTDNFGEYLDSPELDAVIAHELGHVKGRHGWIRLKALASIYLLAYMIALIVPRAQTFLRGVVMIVLLQSTLLVYYYICRRQEYYCDAKAAEFSRDSETAIRSLMAMLEPADVPLRQSKWVEMYMTHPSLENRIAAIRRTAGKQESFRAALVSRTGRTSEN